MTYISIPVDMRPYVDAGHLSCLPSMLTGFETARMMFVSLEVLEAADKGVINSGPEAGRFAEFRQTLDAFDYGVFSVSQNPFAKPGDAMLARVHPVAAEI